MLSWYCFQIFFILLLTIPVAPMITVNNIEVNIKLEMCIEIAN
jgi:hypothetical protein